MKMAAGLAQRMRLTRPGRVLASRLADGPSVVGWLKPVVLIPAAALAGLDVGQLEAILTHELVHIRRQDYLVNLLQTVAETLLFYHPALWWISSRMRQERELCCDDLVVKHCGDRIGYARALARLERMRVAPEPAVAANAGPLLYRVQRLTGAVRECAPLRAPVVLALIAAVLSVPPTVHRAQGQAQSNRGEAPNALTAAATHDPNPALRVKAMQALLVQAGQHAVVAMEQGAPGTSAADPEIPGTASVEAMIGADGSVADARVLEGPVDLRKAALRATLDWQFANAKTGESRRVRIDFGPDSKMQVRTDAAPTSSMEAERLRQMELTERFLKDELDDAGKRLEEAKGQTANLDQLKSEVAEKERQLAGVQPAKMLAEDELARWQTDFNRQIEEVNLAVAAADRDISRDRETAGAMNNQVDALRRQLELMSKSYGPNHPEIKSLQAKIAAGEHVMAKFIAGRKLVRIDRDPLWADFHFPVAVGDTLTEDSVGAIYRSGEGV